MAVQDILSESLPFQFQTGAIKRNLGCKSGSTGRPRFNSKLVRLKGYAPSQMPSLLPRFNSKLVRLKAPAPPQNDSAEDVFQFQTGAIKSLFELISVEGAEVFQFQTGAIKSRLPTHVSPRLITTFQFQTGAIKRYRLTACMCFVIRVSIPNWCD